MTEKQLRELDAFIAEKVMGWYRQKFDNGYAKHNLLVSEKFRADEYRKHGWHDGVELIQTFPKFSTDPAAAMQVLEKICILTDCKDIGFGHCQGMDWAGGNWYAYLIYRENPGHRGKEVVNAPTLPLAIALFAQKLFSK